MYRLIGAFARNAVFANILMALIFFAGGLATVSMVREMFPEFSIDQITIQVPYPGADPEEVEEGISRKIEEAIDGLEGIKRYHSGSSENMGVTRIEVKESYDVSEVKDRVRNQIDAISNFPLDAEQPIIEEVTYRAEVITLALAGPLSERQLKEWGEEIKDELRRLPEISQVEIVGSRPYEIGIEVSESKLREYGLSFGQVAAAVRESSLNLAGGTLRTKGEEIRVRTLGRKYTGEEFADIVLMARPDGELITLDRVATIDDGFEEDAMDSRLNGEPSVLLIVYKTSEEDAIAISEVVHAFAETKQATVPPDLTVKVWNDRSIYIRGRINLLVRNGLIGLAVVFFVLWVFLDSKLSFWAGMGIPISIAGALGIMWAVGATINMISLFGMIMVVGIIVDDAIVVGEAIYVHRRNGDGPLEAAINGTREVGMPVMAAVTTSIIAFLPLMFVGGVMGKFISIMPVVVIAALAISLVECLLLLPAHLNHLPDPKAERKNPSGFRRATDWVHDHARTALESFINKLYAPFLRKTLHWRYVAMAVAVFVLLLTGGLAQGGFIKFVMFPVVDGDEINTTIEFPNGTPVEVTRDAVARLEGALRTLADETETVSGEPLIRNMYSVIGGQLPGPPSQQAVTGPHAAGIRAELLEQELRGVSSKALLAAWEREVGPIPGVVSMTFTDQESGPGGAPIEVWLLGEDMDKILGATDALMAKLRSFEGVYQVRSGFRPGKNEMRFVLKPHARTLGLTVDDLAGQVRAGYFGAEAVRLQRGRDDIRVRVRYPKDERQQVSTLQQTRIRTSDGREVPLGSVADIEFTPGYSSISRTDGLRRVIVSADIDTTKKDINAAEIRSELELHYFPQLTDEFKGVVMSLQGDQKDNQEALGSLAVGFPIALLGIFVVIATVFRSYVQPLIIMITVPFGIIGAVYGHLLLGFPVTMLSMFGIVALSGVVVNDAIVLIECFNGLVAKGTPFFEALVRAGQRRFRAIFLTTVSTCGGLGPIILETDLQAQFLIPMALSIASGVLFATVLTLVLIPCLLAILNDLRRVGHYLRQREWPTPEEVEPSATRYLDDDHAPGPDAVAIPAK
jgi:multidrug efflux pump subunit AcrB